eukprot:4203592-Prorocentrum_lima.AAC.1
MAPRSCWCLGDAPALTGDVAPSGVHADAAMPNLGRALTRNGYLATVCCEPCWVASRWLETAQRDCGANA